MRIGLMHGARREPFTLGEAVELAVRAESDGFDSVWFPQLPTFGPDALTVIALAGAQTERIQLGTAVLPTFPTHPLTMAKQALTTQAACGGRFTLGLGLSHKPMIEDVMGLSYDNPARHMREYLEVTRSLIDDHTVDFQGQEFQVKADLTINGALPVPIVIAALAPRMLRMAGEIADGTATWMAGVRTIGDHIAPRINSAAQSVGRTDPRVVVGLPVAVTDDPNGARDAAAHVFERYGQLINYRRLLDIEGVEGPSEVAVIGNESQVEQQLRAFASAGATEFIASVLPVDGESDESIDRTKRVLSSLVGKI